jgi:hypothetical protein
MSKENLTNSSNWETFWKDNPTGFNDTMARSTQYFAEQLDQRFPIRSTDRFLDVGCGPGFLVSYLNNKCKHIHGTDISEQYIEICKQQFFKAQDVTFSVSKAYDYAAYDHLIKTHKINRMVLLSILQYYQSELEVKNLISSLMETANTQSFSCLLADIIPIKHSTFGDISNIIKHAFKRGYTLQFIKFLFYAIFSDYRKMKKTGFLQVDESFFINLKNELNLNLRIIKDLTIHTGRYSVLIDF